MAKSVGKIVQSMNGKLLSTRQASRLAQNERRKAQRRLAKIINEETDKKATWKNAVEIFESLEQQSTQGKALVRTIKGLQATQVEGSKKKEGYSVSIEREAESIAAYTQIRYGSETLAEKGNVSLERRNKMFERQLNQSTTKNGLSALDRDDTKAFYASTMDLWNGLSNADNRNAQIMMKFGVSDLSQVYKLLTSDTLKAEDFGFSDEDMFQDWLKELDERVQFSKRREIIQNELQSIKGSRKSGGSTNDANYNGKEEKTPETSPEYVNRIISRIANALNNG